MQSDQTQQKEMLKKRTRAFAIQTIKLVEALPKTRTADILGRQLLRSGTSVGANYRASCRAKSTPDFIAKMGIAEEEADECCYWLELLVEAGVLQSAQSRELHKEASEITAIAVASINTARRNMKAQPKDRSNNPKSAI